MKSTDENHTLMNRDNSDLFVIDARFTPVNSRKTNKIDTPSREELLASKEIQRVATLQKMAQTGSWEIAYNDKGVSISESLQWSDQVYRIYGYEPKQVKLNSELFYSHVHPEDLDEMIGAVAESLVLKKSFNVGHRIIDKNGKVKYVQQSGEFVFDKGRAISLIGITQDLTEKKTQLLQLQSTRSNLKNILENAETGYVLINDALEVMTYNPKANEFSKMLNGEELKSNKPLLAFIQECKKSKALSAIQHVLNTGTTFCEESCFRLPNGGRIWLKVQMSLILNSQRDVLGVTIALLNITQEKRLILEKEAMNKRLTQRNEVLEQFAYIVSHNLRAPLANILGLSQLITQLNPEDDLFDSTTQGLHQSSANLDQVVKDLNAILKMRDEIKEVEAQVDLEELVQEAIDTLGSQNQPNVQFKLDFNQTRTVKCVKAYMLSIFTNLIGNSIKYSKENSDVVVEVSSSVKRGKVIINFKDNGIGIDLKKHGDNIFKLYKRFHNHKEGRGMGLYMVHSQVLALGGEIKIDSEVGKGTSFTIELPA
ncbi:PAS domain S-box-containing protein [Roseivirga ehrenbergii]|uniref:histidine kinase n=1 Tax=Roseivirga ehrenbergii (strain DSM 102268 / JCM 13514 / KCTC 12282 / NCIMB 14502 / KMM 6017) TaxID=279360 RepID=A0A150X878_ROSEK|nr:PAS domain-containing protein [Roseivirga ehrenbergii]KYG74929.1 hypothetical protein MB14_06925 [Roseivirga ehrenbergii]TCL13730.1 PAS domain S-box-containing protein [Roseivirga ehrenbergii]